MRNVWRRPLLLLLVFLASFLSAHAVTAQTTVNVILTSNWTDTGISVTSGQQFTVTATGQLNWYTGGCPRGRNCITTPDGDLGGGCSPRVPAPKLTCWSLIGRIGQRGEPFQVGTHLDYTVPDGISGEFYLGVNDFNLPDNTGEWKATITQGVVVGAPCEYDTADLFGRTGRGECRAGVMRVHLQRNSDGETLKDDIDNAVSREYPPGVTRLDIWLMVQTLPDRAKAWREFPNRLLPELKDAVAQMGKRIGAVSAQVCGYKKSLFKVEFGDALDKWRIDIDNEVGCNLRQ